MASYYVLTPQGSTNPEKDTRFVRDGFSWLAFIFPLPWLLVRKLWLMAGLAVVFYLLSVLVAEYWGLDALPVAFSFILSLWAGIEGGHVRAYWMQRRGWDLKATIVAHDLDEAEAIYFSGDAMDDTIDKVPMRGAPVVGHVHRPATSVALGLIGPYGNR